MHNEPSAKQAILGFLSFFSIVVGLFIGLVAIWNIEKTNAGEVKIVRNGGLFDNKNVRQIIQPGQGLTWTGFFSETHTYPAQQRFYTITSKGTGDGGAADVVETPSSDGVEVGIEGTLYFNLTRDEKTLIDFDNRFGTRTFGGLYPYDGDEGWSAFLNEIARPVIDNNLRKQVGNFTCGELVSSCALVQNQGAKVNSNQGKKNNENIARIEQAINKGFLTDLGTTLGGNFLQNVKFQLVRVVLPKEVSNAVKQAQAAFAEVTKAQARVEQAKAEGDANRQRQKGYNSCPACAEIDKTKAIPPNITTYAPGGGFAVTGKR